MGRTTSNGPVIRVSPRLQVVRSGEGGGRVQIAGDIEQLATSLEFEQGLE
jgi:hypothetical protein